MRQVLRKITSLLLAFLIPAATVSWTVEKHYCLGNLIDIALFQEAESCSMTAARNLGTSSFNIEEPSCCSNEVISIRGLEDLTYSVKDLNLVVPFAFMAPREGQTPFLELLDLLSMPDNYNPPPLLVRNIHLLYQVFLI